MPEQSLLKQTIQSLEEKLKTAMLHSDVAVLNDLMVDDLIFTNHIGMCLTKQDDINAHVSGKLKIIDIALSEQQICCHNATAIVSVLAEITGQYDGQPANGKFRFTRVWNEVQTAKWQVIAAHSSIIV